MPTENEAPNFRGRRVLAFESRRVQELAALIATYGGQAISAPALREVPLASNQEALSFAAALLRNEFDLVIFLTGVGARVLATAAELVCPRDQFIGALSRTKVVVRGPKPLAVLREWQVPVWINVPDPNTWREILAALDARAGEKSLRDANVAVQEHGESSVELLDGLRERGALVTAVSVYRWALPEDLEPLRRAVHAVAALEVDVALFTTGIQVVHLWQIAGELGAEAELLNGLARTVIVSIGPSTSDELRRHGVTPDLEPSHPKIGFLVREAAERSVALLQAKRGG